MTNQNKKKPGVKRKIHGFRILTLFMAIIVGFELVFGAVGAIAIGSLLEGTPEFKLDDFTNFQSTIVLDASGNKIADVGTTLRENVVYDQIPESLVDAFLSIEDSRYFQHNGFDIPRFTKSVLETVLRGSMQGGSTFTMQLVKLTYFQDDESGTSTARTIQYKVQQIALAMELEKNSGKQEIFSMYLNKMNYGGIGNIRGVQKAAQQYFGKNVWELNLSESALLAGVINSPYTYDPHNYLDRATSRRDTVLNMMVYHGYITQEECDLAKSIHIENQLIDPSTTIDTDYTYQAYIDAALREAREVTGLDPMNVSMEIHTNMDATIQAQLESIQAGTGGVDFPDDLFELGSIVMNNQTGEVVGILGGRNWANGGSMLLNHATEQYNQPGSAVKPILDYALAFEDLGWATDHMMVDKPVSYGNWTFNNFDNRFRGAVDLSRAVGESLNTVAINTLQAVIDKSGQKRVTDYLTALGFTGFTPDQFDISFAIGGGNMRVTVEELAAAESVVMNGGNYIKPHTIKQITYRNANRDPYVAPTTGTNVLSPQAAYLAATLMRSAVSGSSTWGNYMYAIRKNYAVYGKTGTSDWGDAGVEYGIPIGAAKDEWMVGQTTQFTIAVWTGYEKAIAGQNTYLTRPVLNWNIPGVIISNTLDTLESIYGTPGELGMPDGISQITHIKGLYPYVAPDETIPSEYVSTGLIKSEYATLGAYTNLVTTPDNLSTFNAAYDENSETVNFNWATYPNAEKLTEASKDDKTFDISWITGPIVYKARISQNGNTVAEITSTDATFSTAGSNLQPNTETQVCGYYGYQNNSTNSNEVCVTFTTPEAKVEVPSYNLPTLYTAWGAANNITIQRAVGTTDASRSGQVEDVRDSSGNSVIGQRIKKGSTITVYLYF
ncbi:MAG: penicillin-binding protein [Erysipelotrichaceae bacterium]|nr:penicillin-binding protein [Erysipelotrichaceae bacterium]